MNNSGAGTVPKEPLACSHCGAPTDDQSQLCSKCAAARKSGAPKANVISWCKKHERSIRQWSHSIGNFSQVIALLLVGFWTIKTYNRAEQRFSYMEEASLKPHLRTGISLEWKRIPKVTDSCIAELTLSLENPSRQSIEITQLHVRGWLTAIANKEHPPFIPDEELRQSKPFFDKVFTGNENYLLGPLQPTGKADDSFLFQLPNDSTKRLFMEADFETKAVQELGYRPWAAKWDFLCNYNVPRASD